MKKFRVYDAGDKVLARYTFVILEPGSKVLHFWGVSENPFHPQGFGQYCGSSADYHPCTPGPRLGTKVRALEDLPERVREYFLICALDTGWPRAEVVLS